MKLSMNNLTFNFSTEGDDEPFDIIPFVRLSSDYHDGPTVCYIGGTDPDNEGKFAIYIEDFKHIGNLTEDEFEAAGNRLTADYLASL